MTYQKIIIIIGLALMALSVNAQTFVDNLRKTEQGKGTVTVQQSKGIDDLVNGNATGGSKTQTVTTTDVQKHGGSTSVTQKIPTTTAQQNVGGVRNNETAKPEQGSSSVKEDDYGISENIDMDVVVDTRKKVMRNSYKTTGYRIQVFSGGNSRNDRQKAEQAGVAMKRMFPNEPVYVHFYSPAWKCRMGNYRSVAEAQKILKQVKTAYPQACIVKGTISVQY